MASKTLIFVYGSLRRGEQHHGQMEGAEFVGERRTRAFYRVVTYVEGYPALVRAAEGGLPISGELYGVTNEHLARLDEFEECPTLYQRQSVSLEDGTEAQAYLIGDERRGAAS